MSSVLHVKEISEYMYIDDTLHAGALIVMILGKEVN